MNKTTMLTRGVRAAAMAMTMTMMGATGLAGVSMAQAQVASPVAGASLCEAPATVSALRGTYQLDGEGPLPIELVLVPREGASARLFEVTGLVSEGEHRFGVTGMAYCTGAGHATLAFDVTMSGGFHDTPVDDELRRAWPAGKAPKRASSAGTSVVHAEVALASMRGWAEAMRTIVLTGQRVMGPRHVSATLVFNGASATGEAGRGR